MLKTQKLETYFYYANFNVSKHKCFIQYHSVAGNVLQPWPNTSTSYISTLNSEFMVPHFGPKQTTTCSSTIAVL